FGPIVLLALFFSKESSTPATAVFLLGGFVLLVVVAGLALTRVWHSRWLSAVLTELDDTSAQLRVRAAIAILVAFVALADRLGLEAILGAFLAGGLLRLVDRDEQITFGQFRTKLEALGFGFLVPVFF